MKKDAFNKYNAPELVGQLFSVLEKNELHDAVEQLRRCKVPQTVNQAWKQRNKRTGDSMDTSKRVAHHYLQAGVKSALGWKKLPKGWTQESVKKFWTNLTSGAPKHKVTECIKKMEGKVPNPGAFCASCCDMVEGNTDWRKGPRKKKGAVSTKEEFQNLFLAELKRRWPHYARPKDIGSDRRGNLVLQWREAPGVAPYVVIHSRPRILADVDGLNYSDPKKAAKALADWADVLWDEARDSGRVARQKKARWDSRASYSPIASALMQNLERISGVANVEINDEWKDGYYNFFVRLKPSGTKTIFPTARGRDAKVYEIKDYRKILGAIRRVIKSSGVALDGLAGPKKLYEYQDKHLRRRQEPAQSGYVDTVVNIEFYVSDMVRTANQKQARPVQFLTQKDKKNLPPLYSQENEKDPMVWVKFFHPYGRGTWLAIEFDGRDRFFGYVMGLGGDELGYFSLRELKSLKGPAGAQGIERDRHFKPMPLSQAKRRG